MSYIIPTVKSINDWVDIKYVDPTSPTNGSGTIGNPYNTINGIGSGYTIPGNTAYLIKRGTTLNERVRKTFVNCYIGAYGEGAMPVVRNGFRIEGGSNGLTIDGLDIKFHDYSNDAGYNAMIIFVASTDGGSQNIEIINNKITGVYKNQTYMYPYRAIWFRGYCINATVYNNIISYVADDGIGCISSTNVKIVRNWIHHVDMKRVGNEYGSSDPEGSVYNWDCGDCIHMNNNSGVYIAGNLLDRSLTSWKFALIVKRPVAGSDYTIEYNTAYGNNGGNTSGAILYLEDFLNVPTTIRNNILDTSKMGTIDYGIWVLYQGTTSLVPNSDVLSNQTYPLGVYDNHVIWNTAKGFYNFSAGHANFIANNEMFSSYGAYETFLTTNSPEGTDIDP
jgi:archaellin